MKNSLQWLKWVFAYDTEIRTEMNLDVCKCHAHTSVIMELSKYLNLRFYLRKWLISSLLSWGQLNSDSRDKNWS